MKTDLILVALVVGVGTWLFRFLPTRLGDTRGRGGPRVAGAMESIGPAAIATLFIASLLPYLTTGVGDRALGLIGCIATVSAFWVKRDVALATITGAVAYGFAFVCLGG